MDVLAQVKMVSVLNHIRLVNGTRVFGEASASPIGSPVALDSGPGAGGGHQLWNGVDGAPAVRPNAILLGDAIFFYGKDRRRRPSDSVSKHSARCRLCTAMLAAG